MDTQPLLMSIEASVSIGEALQLFFDSYQALARQAIENRSCTYKVRPKLHYLAHLRRHVLATRLNPRKLSCFLDEDFVGRIAAITRKCPRRGASRRVLQRFHLKLGTRWLHRVRFVR